MVLRTVKPGDACCFVLCWLARHCSVVGSSAQPDTTCNVMSAMCKPGDLGIVFLLGMHAVLSSTLIHPPSFSQTCHDKCDLHISVSYSAGFQGIAVQSVHPSSLTEPCNL